MVIVADVLLSEYKFATAPVVPPPENVTTKLIMFKAATSSAIAVGIMPVVPLASLNPDIALVVTDNPAGLLIETGRIALMYADVALCVHPATPNLW